MVKAFWVSALFSLLVSIRPQFCYAQDSIEISLLSCSPGVELYSTFGHSALRIKNFTTGQDLVYNYGTFHFNDKNFYLKFLQGKLNYYLTVSTFDRFMYEYTVENRSVFEQIFSLNTAQKYKLYADLKINALPENRAYKYDFFWDNCSTRIRDMIQHQFADSLHYPAFKVKPFRSYLHDYLSDQPWSKFGIDLILGLPCDAMAGTKEAMFLPLEMMKAYDSTMYKTGWLATHSQEILSSVKSNGGKRAFSPLFAATALFLISLILNFLKKAKIWNTSLILATGIAGCIIFFLWFLSDHISTKNNLHFIWANPLLLLYPFRKKVIPGRFLKALSTIYFVLILILILIFPFNIQKMPLTCIPIWLSLLLVLGQETTFYDKLIRKKTLNA